MSETHALQKVETGKRLVLVSGECTCGFRFTTWSEWREHKESA